MEMYITWNLPNIACTDEKRYIYPHLYLDKTTTDTKSMMVLKVMSQLYYPFYNAAEYKELNFFTGLMLLNTRTHKKTSSLHWGKTLD